MFSRISFNITCKDKHKSLGWIISFLSDDQTTQLYIVIAMPQITLLFTDSAHHSLLHQAVECWLQSPFLCLLEAAEHLQLTEE